ncbi:MAG: hypothetical protein NVSMB6_17630 [Burkholderiaceae bacterium]
MGYMDQHLCMLDARKPRSHAKADASPVDLQILRKPVNTLAIVPKSARITSLGRKTYNVLLYEAQDQGLDREVYSAPLERIVKGIGFDSNDHALIKKHLRAMVSTTVEWQSPTTGEGSAWNVSGLLAHAKLSKHRGQVWVEWSYAVNLKQELLHPTVFARLKLEIISQLRSHAGIALYEICTRYKDIGRTSRQNWRWWRPVLCGQPDSEKTARLEYRIFKRDTLKPAIAEMNAITDLEVELVEHKDGRTISEVQFLIRNSSQPSLALVTPPAPVDLELIARARALGIDDEKADDLIEDFGADAVKSGLEVLATRVQKSFPEPLRDRFRYLKSVMPGEALKAEKKEAELQARAMPPEMEKKNFQAKRHARWVAEWNRRQRASVVEAISAMSPETQDRMCADLLSEMERRNVHPTLRKRLQSSGWQHPLVLQEMIRWYAAGALGEHWDKPTPQQLLEVAAEMGDEEAAVGKP